MPPPDPHDLARFVQAQAPVLDAVREELSRGSKQTHWMWFVFPQLRQLGRSATAQHYGLAGLDEARAYLAHPLLGRRLHDGCERLLALPPGRTALQVFGATDALKLRSSMTLFTQATQAQQPEPAREPAQGTVFAAVLQRFFAGEPDPLTLALLRGAPPA